MLKKLFALSDQGERELKHGIVATTIGHLESSPTQPTEKHANGVHP